MTVSEQSFHTDQRAHRTRYVVVAAVVLGLALRLSCWPLGRRIPFESFSSGFHSQAEGCELFLPVKYRIVVGTTPDEVREIARCLGGLSGSHPLAQVDLSKQFVVVAMTRWTSIGPPSPPAEILRICQKGNRVLVTARLAPDRFTWPLQMRLQRIAYPHDIVVIDRSALKKGGELKFALVDRLGLSLASVRHTVTVEP